MLILFLSINKYIGFLKNFLKRVRSLRLDFSYHHLNPLFNRSMSIAALQLRWLRTL